ncbi:class I SAM-dependent methyltransferase [Hyphomonas sp. FCG-A18]|uniref:class I SAM-dependent methyltransferase n=1 Tax=Hyphomonas sp. FCG-A18 TaxID=3080019 RepID=UPI002B2DEE1D|nr:class I SAM-dependent methyltransferase [Hyphomonas sp. FCG-A18]
MADKSKFWNKIAEKYSRDPIADQQSYEIKLDITRDYFTPDSEVLEIGAGTGSTAILHAPYVKHIHGVDISEEMVRIARDKLKPAGIENVSFEVADVDTYHGQGKTYDVVMAMSLVHLVEDRAALFEKVKGLLKPGGVFVSSTVCLGDHMAYMAPVFAVGRALGFLPIVKVFKSERLQNELVKAGFKIVHHWRPAKGKAVFLVCQKPD